ncbi:MAG: hypothetical protein ABL958_21460, partial [Bdellovibrionia bacterium]
KARDEMRSGRPEGAVKILEPLALQEGDDQLVYLLDYAVALQEAGRFDESNRAFLKAQQLADIKDYHSLSRITGSLLLSEGMVQYKGEDYEKLLIHVYLALNFLMLDKLDDALVETKQIDIKLTKYRLEAKREYEQNPFARYLSAMIWEADRKWDDAYIDYKTAYNLRPSVTLLKEDLLRTSLLSRRTDDLAGWRKAFPEVKTDNWWKDKSYGEIVLIFQQGRAPVKRPHPDSHRFPKLYAVPSITRYARIEVDGGPTETSQPIYSVQDIAIKTLDDAYAGLVAKRIGGVVAKHVVAEEIRKKDELLGAIAWIGMNIADQADLRQWSTLPETFQVARVPIKSGKYRVRVQGLDGGLGPSGEQMPEREVEIRPGKKAFVIWRSFN